MGKTEFVLEAESLSLEGDSEDLYYANINNQGPEIIKLSRLLKTLRQNLPEPIDRWKKPVVLDIGANIGLTACFFAKRFPRGEIYAFEPSPKNYAFLEANLASNDADNVTALNLAVSDRVSELEFHHTANGAAAHVITKEHLLLDSLHADPGSTIKVPATTIDEFVSRHLKKVDFIKIDVEGYEREVLEGAVNTFNNSRCPIYMKFNSWTLIGWRNQKPQEFLRFLLDRFLVSSVDANGNHAPVPDTEHGLVSFLHRNLTSGCVDGVLLMPRST